MSNLERQVFPALDTSGAETQVQLYQGNHKLPSGANGWIVSYFKGQE